MCPSSVAARPASGFNSFLEFIYGGPENIPRNYRENVPPNDRTTTTHAQSAIRSLVAEANVPSAKGEELLRAYAGKEDVLLENLGRVKRERERLAKTKKEIKALVKETKAPKSAEELMAVYKGHYGDLLIFLRRLKAYHGKLKAYQGKAKAYQGKLEAYQGTKTSARSPVVKTSVEEERSTEELLETYEGNEDPLPVDVPRETYLEPPEPWLVELSKTEVPDASTRDLLPGPPNLADASTRDLVPGSKNLADIDIDDDEDDDALMASLEDRASGEMKAKQERDADAIWEISARIEENADAKDEAGTLAGHHRGREEPLPTQLSEAKTNRERDEETRDEGTRDEETRASVRALAAQTSATMSADELLGAYGGREEVPLKNPDRMKAKEEGEARTREEIDALLEQNAVPRDKVEMLKERYRGREEELLKQLGRMRVGRAKYAKKAEKAEEIKSLAAQCNIDMSADHLAKAYKGKEDVLLKNLRRMSSTRGAKKAKKAEKAEEIKSLAAQCNIDMSADHPAKAFEGKDEKQLKNLRWMSSTQGIKKAKEAGKAEEIRSLAAQFNIDVSHLVKAYEGKEAQLLKNLHRMSSTQGIEKAKKAGKAEEIRSLAAQSNIDVSHLVKAYEGKEEQLLKNLRRMSSTQGIEKAKEAGKAEEIRLLAVQCNIDVSHLVKAYEGKEEQLLKNLRRMSSAQDIEKAKEAEKADKIKLWAAQCNIDVSADHLPKTCAEKAKETEKAEEIKSLAAQCNIDTSADHLAKAYEGKEDVLLKNLRRMSSSRGAEKAREAEKAEEIRSLISQCNIDSSADDLLKAFEGEEDVLLNGLRRMSTITE